MAPISHWRWIFGATALVLAVAAPAAQAQDFISLLFGGFGRPPMIRPPFDDGPPAVQQRIWRPRAYDRSYDRAYSGGGQAFCVRTCDGRYFPLPVSDNASRAQSCNNFCPASETKLVYGGSIDNAETEDGTAYSELPNAFRYRNEIVAGCTCNGKDPGGLAQVKIEDDPTLRKGDIVASENGLMVAGRPDKRGASLQLSPAPDRIRAKYGRVPVVARE
ncbi:DUF2865 domain-containing protein [Bradyrhizobium sp. Arg237L]|uniref:DUF2865 domain-containing protein n=1 Tax=Bradyrhizobium sp. Arg237L TaxID=3003352 RepID=UPI00249E887D|nr:DUF2865 domain-containing protein [Bradyrhizobium sp. Arg237L]MDI4232638.1 DUF2865 domain-containing protein [Bradyrhizobium sp. Arg237L]